MPIPSIPHVSVGTPEDLDVLARTVENAINSLVDRINAAASTTHLNMEQQRITNLAVPASRRDAVNVEYLDAALQKVYKRLYNETARNIEESVSNVTVNVSLTGVISYA